MFKSQRNIWWVVLLLAGAVIVPTVCLLWFMGQAVKNTQFAMKQKMLDFYEGQLRIAGDQQLELVVKQQILPIFSQDNKRQAMVESVCVSVLLYDVNGILLEPSFGDIATPTQVGSLFEGESLEYDKNDPNGAIAAYQAIAQKTDANSVRIAAVIGQARCLTKLKKNEQAISLLREVSRKRYRDKDMATHVQRCYAAMFLVDTVSQKDEHFKDDVLSILTGAGFKMPVSTRGMALNKFITLAEKINTDPVVEKCLQTARIALRSDRVAMAVLENYSDMDITKGHRAGVIYSIGQGRFYAMFDAEGESKKYKIALIFTKERVREMLTAYIGQVREAQCQIYDDKGQLVIGQASQNTEPFLSVPLNETFFPKWSVKLYLAEQSLFEKNASRQKILYLWAGVLVIVFMLGASGVGGGLLVRQIRLNRLKNDFLATVSHELRTPLASMRLMLDTVLEGRYEDSEKAREYLELASKENQRLTRLIENFLSFSKMTRNKKSFDMVMVEPAEIVAGAGAAIKSKYDKNKCEFDVTVAGGLPAISVDKDAMVTVLVNLLDNACKYSGDDKHIRLNVFYSEGYVNFQVADNGIGLSRGAVRKIFDKFYQVDQTLTRKAEGCGLGLSIVKFIVEAHKGKIKVESKQGRGSTFVVMIPAARE